VFQAAYERRGSQPGRDLPRLVDESFAAPAGMAGERAVRQGRQARGVWEGARSGTLLGTSRWPGGR
jgi:hypothetical protein